KITSYNHHLRLLLSPASWSLNQKTNSGFSWSLRSYPISSYAFRDVFRDLGSTETPPGRILGKSEAYQRYLPFHPCTPAHVGSEVPSKSRARPRSARCRTRALSQKPARYPMLRGAIRDHVTQQRRPFLRFFACEEDLSHELPDAPLPDAVASGKEPFIVIGAIAGG